MGQEMICGCGGEDFRTFTHHSCPFGQVIKTGIFPEIVMLRH